VPEPPDDCQICAACCFSELLSYVRVTGDDFERLGDDAERLTSFIENRAFMRMHDGHCAALELDTDARRWRCTIYERRPETCRHLERGSPECAGERWAKAERPLIELRRIGGGG
jgi:Fe-S-cluster containining protein